MPRFLLLAVASGPLLAAMAHAQQVEDKELRASTVIVTAPGPDRNADELIGNATVIEREDILEILAGSLGDTLDRQPGVSTTFFGQAASRPVLRGLGAERVQVLTNGIGVIDASAASPDHQVAADGIDAERIEILRGSAALAYGGQAIGGVVNVIDGLIVEDLPDDPVSADLFGAYDSVNAGSELAGRAQMAKGPFVFTLTGSQRDFGDYDIPGFARSALRRAADGEDGPQDSLPNSFAETQSLAGGASWVGASAFLGAAIRQQTATYGLPGEADESPFIDLEQTRVDLRGGVSVNNGLLTDIVGTFAVGDYTHTEFEAAGEPGTVYESDGVEGRVEFGHAIGSFEGAFGVQYLDKELRAFGDEAFITPTTTKSVGAFLYETREWDNGFGVEGGLRIESVELANVISGSVDFDLLSGSFGLHQHFDSGVFFGGQLSYTERAPNESELFAFGPHLASEQFEVGNAELGKESGLNLEGTARWRGENGGIGINLFVTEFSDFTFLTPSFIVEDGVEVSEADGLPVFAFVQDDASFIGGEIYADYTFRDGPLSADWTFDASVDLVRADLDGGGNVPFIPPVTLNAGASAEWGAWEVGTAITFAGDQDDPGAGQLPTDGYTTLDLRAEVDLSDFGFGADGTEAFIEARNVTDEEVRYSTSVLKDVAPAPGQNIRVGIRVAF